MPLTITIPSELEDFVDQEVASGKFRSREAVIAEALEQFRYRERKLDVLRADIQLALEQLDSGQFTLVASDGDREALIDRIRSRNQP